MKKFSWEVRLGILLVLLSAFLYIIHYVIFRDVHHIFIYLLGDIAFLPLEVFLVTIIIHRLLSEREKRLRLEKLNMVIETFFSEVGIELLAYFSDFDPKLEGIKKELIVTNEWTDNKFDNIIRKLRIYDYSIAMKNILLKDLRNFLVSKRDFLLRLLENPNLLEHESFTDLLMAVFHLTEEIGKREDLSVLPETDEEHLGGDIKRVYILLVHEWLDYMKYLKHNYPYLFSLAMRTNPFDKRASILIR